MASASCASSSASTSISSAPWTSTSSELFPDTSGRTRLYTVGHSTRPISELIELLGDYGITQLVDVRHYPTSRRNPRFNRERLASELPARGVSYVWEGEMLGGLRNGGYVAYMAAPLFARGIARLEQLAARRPTAIMCAEIVWFRCHRRFIARQMVQRGYRVTHIVARGKPGYEESLLASSRST